MDKIFLYQINKESRVLIKNNLENIENDFRIHAMKAKYHNQLSYMNLHKKYEYPNQFIEFKPTLFGILQLTDNYSKKGYNIDEIYLESCVNSILNEYDIKYKFILKLNKK